MKLLLSLGRGSEDQERNGILKIVSWIGNIQME